MRQIVILAALVLALTACAPTTTVTPLQTEERVTTLSFEEAYAQTVNVINTQPFPSDSGGWFLTQSDQVGGFVEAQLNGNRCTFFGCTAYTGRVSVALIRRGDGTAVSLSLNRHGESQKLADRISERLGLAPL